MPGNGSPIVRGYYDRFGTKHGLPTFAGDSPAAHYLGKYVTVDGIKFPTERRVYVAGPDGKPMPDLMTVSIDLSNYRFV